MAGKGAAPPGAPAASPTGRGDSAEAISFAIFAAFAFKSFFSLSASASETSAYLPSNTRAGCPCYSPSRIRHTR